MSESSRRSYSVDGDFNIITGSPRRPLSEHEASSADSVVRAITDDGSFRVITASTTHTVRQACAVQQVSGKTTECFSDLITGAVLFRETMAPSLRVQVILNGSAKTGRLVADSHPSGNNRGLVQLAAENEIVEFGEGARLHVMRSLANGQLQQGVVDAQSGDSISSAYMTYMQNSEQVISMIALNTLIENGEIIASGGYIVQLMPEVGTAPLAIMTERLDEFRGISGLLAEPEFSPDKLMKELLYGMPYTRLDASPVNFGCWCSEAAMIGAIATLPPSEVEELARGGELLEVGCDYCKTEYKLSPQRLQGMLNEN